MFLLEFILQNFYVFSQKLGGKIFVEKWRILGEIRFFDQYSVFWPKFDFVAKIQFFQMKSLPAFNRSFIIPRIFLCYATKLVDILLL